MLTGRVDLATDFTKTNRLHRLSGKTLVFTSLLRWSGCIWNLQDISLHAVVSIIFFILDLVRMAMVSLSFGAPLVFQVWRLIGIVSGLDHGVRLRLFRRVASSFFHTFVSPFILHHLCLHDLMLSQLGYQILVVPLVLHSLHLPEGLEHLLVSHPASAIERPIGERV